MIDIVLLLNSSGFGIISPLENSMSCLRDYPEFSFTKPNYFYSALLKSFASTLKITILWVCSPGEKAYFYCMWDQRIGVRNSDSRL